MDESIARLHQAARCIRQSENAAQWAAAVEAACASYADRAAVLIVENAKLRWNSALLDAPALRHAMGGQDTVVTLLTASQIGAELAAHFNAAPDGKAWLVPIQRENTTAAMLCASGNVDAPALELIAALAGGALSGLQPATALLGISALPHKKE